MLKELRRDLTSRQANNRTIYYRHYSYYWAEKENDFAKTAEEVLAESPKSSATVTYVTDYLYHGLEHYKRAIEVLLGAHERKILDETGQEQLVRFLHEQQRHAESIAILEPLVERRPELMHYRVLLMRAYYKTDKRDKLLALLADTDKYFHEQKHWTESNIATLASSTLDNGLFEQSVAYFKEAIPLHGAPRPRHRRRHALRLLLAAFTSVWRTAKNCRSRGSGQRSDR